MFADWSEWVRWVKDHGLIAGHVVEGQVIEVGVGVYAGDPGSIVNGRAIVDDIAVEGSSFKLSKCVDEDAVRISHDVEDWATSVSKVVDGEELAAGC